MFKFEVKPFEQMNVCSTLERMIKFILRDFVDVRTSVHDVVWSRLLRKKHMEHFRVDLKLICKHESNMKVTKCTFSKYNFPLIAHIMSQYWSLWMHKKFIPFMKPLCLKLKEEWAALLASPATTVDLLSALSISSGFSLPESREVAM